MTDTPTTVAHAIAYFPAERGHQPDLGLWHKTEDCAIRGIPVFEGRQVLGLATIHLIDEEISGMSYLLRHVQQRGMTMPAVTSADALALIAAERRRQIDVEGYTPGHDDEDHSTGQLAMAAACYALHPSEDEPSEPPQFWPWGNDWWKPGDRVRELVKAGALIVAEIERLQRAAAQAGG